MSLPRQKSRMYGASAAARIDVYRDSSGGPDACWPWSRCCSTGGYGKLSVAGVSLYVTRLILGLPVGGALRALHTCDNPPCCNPAHLYVGTAADNSSDMVRKGRSTHGSHNPMSKLSEAQASRIRSRRDAGTHTEVASIYGVARQTISRIRSGERRAIVTVHSDGEWDVQRMRWSGEALFVGRDRYTP